MISRVMYNLKEAKDLHTAKVSGDDWYFKSVSQSQSTLQQR